MRHETLTANFLGMPNTITKQETDGSCMCECVRWLCTKPPPSTSPWINSLRKERLHYTENSVSWKGWALLNENNLRTFWNSVADIKGPRYWNWEAKQNELTLTLHYTGMLGLQLAPALSFAEMYPLLQLWLSKFELKSAYHFKGTICWKRAPWLFGVLWTCF